MTRASSTTSVSPRAFSADRRRELVDELAPYREVAADDHPWLAAAGPTSRIPGGLSRWSAGKDMTWEPLRPELVAEVSYDHLQEERFRHATTFRRWRPDRTASLLHLRAAGVPGPDRAVPGLRGQRRMTPPTSRRPPSPPGPAGTCGVSRSGRRTPPRRSNARRPPPRATRPASSCWPWRRGGSGPRSSWSPGTSPKRTGRRRPPPTSIRASDRPGPSCTGASWPPDRW